MNTPNLEKETQNTPCLVEFHTDRVEPDIDVFCIESLLDCQPQPYNQVLPDEVKAHLEQIRVKIRRGEYLTDMEWVVVDVRRIIGANCLIQGGHILKPKRPPSELIFVRDGENFEGLEIANYRDVHRYLKMLLPKYASLELRCPNLAEEFYKVQRQLEHLITFTRP